jgi:hypothetical protein
MYTGLFRTTKRTLRKIKTVLDFSQIAHVRINITTVNRIRKYIDRRESQLTINDYGTEYRHPVVGLNQCETAGGK